MSGIAVACTSGASAPARGYHPRRLDVGGDTYPYLVYAPAGLRGARVPLLVVLHGCSMTAQQQAAASGYGRLADRSRFIVVYPDVDSSDGVNGRCWKGIWDPGADAHGRGDAGAIAAITEQVMHEWPIDRSRVYAIGISAGAFESSILGATHPRLYAAIGVHSGAGYLGGGSGCPGFGEPSATPAALARAALSAMGAGAHVMPVVIFHGDRDPRVPERCGREALQQWLTTDNLILRREHRAKLPTTRAIVTSGAVAHGHTFTVTSYPDRQGCPVAQFWLIHGMGHRWSGGSRDAAVALYSDPRGPSAAAASLAFFLRWRLSGVVDACVRHPTQ